VQKLQILTIFVSLKIFYVTLSFTFCKKKFSDFLRFDLLRYFLRNNKFLIYFLPLRKSALSLKKSYIKYGQRLSRQILKRFWYLVVKK